MDPYIFLKEILLPPLISFTISFFTSMGGVSGAFLLVPVQMSILGVTSVSISSTNFHYNIIGIPGGLARFIREGRTMWPLAAVIGLGSLPGILAGYFIRVLYLPDPRNFKLFVSLVLFFLAFQLIRSMFHPAAATKKNSASTFVITRSRIDSKKISFSFQNREYGISVPIILFTSLVIGTIGGIYGVGGGAFIAPILVGTLGLPVYTIAGATLFGTFVSSLAGLSFYTAIPVNGMTAPPNWILGLLFGCGGLFGMHLGAKCQKFIPEKVIKLLLMSILILAAGRYSYQFFFPSG